MWSRDDEQAYVWHETRGTALEKSRGWQREAGMRNRGQIQLMYIIHLKMALWRLITTYVVTRGTYPFLAVRHECFLDSVPSLYSKLGVVIRLVTWHITVAQLGLNGHKEPYSHTDALQTGGFRGPSWNTWYPGDDWSVVESLWALPVIETRVAVQVAPLIERLLSKILHWLCPVNPKVPRV